MNGGYGGGKKVAVSTDERGVAYVVGPDGNKVFIARNNDPNAKQSFFSNKNWNTATGNYDRSTNWGNVVGLGALGAIAAPAALAAAGVGGGAAASAAGSAASGTGAAAGGGGVLASSSLPVSSLMSPVATSTGGGSGMFGSLMGLLKDPKTLMQAGGRMLGAHSQASADNRGAQINAQALQEQLRQQAEARFFDQMLARAQEGRAAEADAMRKVQQAEHIANRKDFKSSLSPYTASFAPKAATEAEKAAALKMRDDAGARMQAGNVIPMPERSQFMFDPKLLKGGMFERLSGYLGAGLDAYGALNNGKR